LLPFSRYCNLTCLLTLLFSRSTSVEDFHDTELPSLMEAIRKYREQQQRHVNTPKRKNSFQQTDDEHVI
jgi:hypothetical protein